MTPAHNCGHSHREPADNWLSKPVSRSIVREMAYSGEPRMVAQGGGIGRALSGWIRSAGKSSVREIANLSHFRGLVRRFQGRKSQSLRGEPKRISCPPRRQLRGLSEEVMRATGYASVLQTSTGSSCFGLRPVLEQIRIANCDSGQRPIHPCRWRQPPKAKNFRRIQ